MSKESTEKEKAFIELAKKRLKAAVDAENHNRIAAIEDLHFLQGDQWDAGEKQRRKNIGRPCLQINVLPKYSKQVCGEMRKNKSQIKVRPVDSKADVQISKIREGLIYSIEYLSNAESIYDHAGKMLVDCGYGAWRVLTRYTDEDPFVQEIYMERIQNPFSVYFDPKAKDFNYADANWAFIVTKMSRDDFEDEYGKENIPGGDFADNPGIGLRDEYWWDRDNITVAEYFYTSFEEKTMCQLSDGQKLEKKEAEKHIQDAKISFIQVKQDHPEENIGEETVPTIIKERKVKTPSIKWAKITGTDILEEKDWAGKFIPIVLVTGEETNIEGKKYISGLIRSAKDPQRLLNFWHTSACETVALAPKAPWQATAKQIEGYENDYLSANEENLPVLLYNVDKDAANPAPMRLSPGNPPVAIFTEIGRAEQNIKDTIGMYNSDVGDTSNERLRDVSGAAITARQMPGDTATFIYPDNMAKGIAYGGKIINDLIPHIYDTERDARLRNIDGTESFVPINTTVGKAIESINDNPNKFSGMNKDKLINSLKERGPNEKFNDITVGKYDIVITTGPTFATQRAEAVENMVKIAMASRMNPIDKYFILKNSDFPGADDYAEVVRRMIPPNLLPPKDGEAPVPPAPPAPQVMVAQAKVQLDMAKIETEKIKLQRALVQLQKEMSEGDKELKDKILEVMSELSKPYHPMDEIAPPSQFPQMMQLNSVQQKAGLR